MPSDPLLARPSAESVLPTRGRRSDDSASRCVNAVARTGEGFELPCPYPQVERLRPRQVLVAEDGERDAAAAVLDAGPGKPRVEVVAAVHEHGAGVELVADRDGGLVVPRPDRGGEAEGAVVHEAHGLLVRRHLHDPDHGTEALLAHHAHGMVDVDENLRRQVGRSRPAEREWPLLDECAGALAHGFADLSADEIGRGDADHRPERRLRLGRIAEHIGARQRRGALDEILEQALVDIDALDAATGLPGVEEGAVDEVLDREVEIGVGPDIGRVLAAELEPDADEAAGRCLLDRCPAGDRAGEGDVVDAELRINAAVVACDMCTALRSPSGSPAAFAASSIRSAQSGVWCECLRTTALPAISAGTTALTAVR